MILITMAAGLIEPQCENTAGSAALESDLGLEGRGEKAQAPTYSHNDEEARKKASEVDDAGAAAVHEVIVGGRPSAQPVGHGSEDICEDDEQGQIVLEEGGGEDDKEEADGENLGRLAVAGASAETYEGEGDYGLEAGQGHDGQMSGSSGMGSCGLGMVEDGVGG
jgi:hypothetical protein